jgi:SAM-dependent methyltransferase/predicted  nucleic acid-binding Zn-ribbon protein
VTTSDGGQEKGSIAQQESERFDPDRDGPELAYEHVHRYHLAGRLLKGLRVLDLASGSGYGARLLAAAGGRVTALDLARSCLKGFDRAVCADAGRLPFMDACFDAVVCFEAIEHIREPAALVADVQRVLRGPAIFLVSTPDREVYSARAGHRNPHHIAEMSRAEFEALLRDHFTHVGLWGQSLWAGSWTAPLRPEADTLVARRRQVTVDRWQGAPPRVTRGAVRWADPDRGELPVPVYVLAACTNSEQGWRRIRRHWSSNSVLHDPAQWLLGQFDRLLESETRHGGELESQLEQARGNQRDLAEQIVAARLAIDDLEEQVRRAREVADRQWHELDAARVASDDQQRQIVLARSAHDELSDEIRSARAASLAQAQEIDAARTRIHELEADLRLVQESRDALEREIGHAREAIGAQRAELDRAERGAKSFEAQIEAARAAQVDLLDQVERARERIVHQERDLDTVRAREQRTTEEYEQRWELTKVSIQSWETRLTEAREAAGDLERQVDAARRSMSILEEEIAEARRHAALREQEIAAAQAEAIAERRRVAELERSRSRFWARIGHRLADWVDRSGGMG